MKTPTRNQMHPGTTIYIPLPNSTEVEITFRAREYNGIASDPKTIVRDVSLPEAIAAVKHLHQKRTFETAPTIDYPVRS